MTSEKIHPPCDHDGRISHSAKGTRKTVTLISIAAGLYCGRVFVFAPKYQKIYGDLFNPGTRLPSAADFLISNSYGFILLSALLALFPGLVAFRIKSIVAVLVVGLIGIVLQVVLASWAAEVLLAPLQPLFNP